MKLRILLLLLGGMNVWVSQAQLFPALGAQRAGISGLVPLKVEVSPRAAALGSANICLTGDPYATYTNPAALDEMGGLGIAATHTLWAVGTHLSYMSLTKQTDLGSFGLSLGGFNSGEIEERTTFQPEGTGRMVYASTLTAGITYSRQLTDQFSWGTTVRMVHERLADFVDYTAVVDLGFLYETDIKELRFAVLVQNFGPNTTLSGFREIDTTFNSRPINLDAYPAPTVFKLGISLVPYRSESDIHVLTTYAQLNHPNDNAENIRLGAEYAYRQLLFLRLGYKLNVMDQRLPTAGIGLRMRVGRYPMMLDYAFDPMQYLGIIHRIGLSVSINGAESR